MAESITSSILRMRNEGLQSQLDRLKKIQLEIKTSKVQVLFQLRAFDTKLEFFYSSSGGVFRARSRAPRLTSSGLQTSIKTPEDGPGCLALAHQ